VNRYAAAFFCISLFSVSSFLVSQEKKNEFVVVKKKKKTKRKMKEQAYEVLGTKIAHCLECIEKLAGDKTQIKELAQEALADYRKISDCLKDGNDLFETMKKKEIESFIDQQKIRDEQIIALFSSV